MSVTIVMVDHPLVLESARLSALFKRMEARSWLSVRVKHCTLGEPLSFLFASELMYY